MCVDDRGQSSSTHGECGHLSCSDDREHSSLTEDDRGTFSCVEYRRNSSLTDARPAGGWFDGAVLGTAPLVRPGSLPAHTALFFPHQAWPMDICRVESSILRKIKSLRIARRNVVGTMMATLLTVLHVFLLLILYLFPVLPWPQLQKSRHMNYVQSAANL